MLKVAVMGAGAVGCYYGAMLARAGHSVTMIGRPAHVEAMRRRGLVLETRAFTEAVPVAATTEASGVAGADLVLFSVKSDDTESAGREIAPHLIPNAVVISLQNGVDNAERLAAVLGRPVVASAVYVATEMAEAGHVKHHGRGELAVGPLPAEPDIAGALRQAGIPTNVSENVIGALWGKLTVNCAYNAISAISQLPYGRMTEVEGVTSVMRDIVAECVAVAARRGVVLPDDLAEKVLAVAGSMPDQYSSTAQDLARGRRSEIGHLNGFVVRAGEAVGVPTPLNRALLALVRLIEDKAARPVGTQA